MLHWTVETRGTGELVVTFLGEITAHVNFADLPGRGARWVTLDLAGVRRLNSPGVHAFLEFLTELGSTARIAAERCSPAIVVQLNMLPTLSRLLVVRSFFVPLECDRCLHEDEVLVELPEPTRRPVLPAPPCPKCGAGMLPAEPLERYFAFLGDEA